MSERSAIEKSLAPLLWGCGIALLLVLGWLVKILVGEQQALTVARRYWPVAVGALGQTAHTHVQVTGVVAFVSREADGDLHLRIQDARGAFLVAECIPRLPCRVPRVGDTVTVRGIARIDREHHWPEVHPVESGP